MLVVGLAWTLLGYGHWLIGDYRTALEFSEKGLKIHTDLGLPFLRSFCHWCYSLAHFTLGNLDEAKIQAEQGLQCSQSSNEKLFEGNLRIFLGRILAKSEPGQIQSAEGHIRQGISLLEELGSLPCSGWGYFCLGEVYAESGRKEEALTNLKKTETMFQEMGMDYWLSKAREVLARI